MSYQRIFPCSSCVKRGEKEGDGKCIDAVRIEEAINKIHGDPADGKHQGSGYIILFCSMHKTE